jgi:hypothetical protein
MHDGGSMSAEYLQSSGAACDICSLNLGSATKIGENLSAASIAVWFRASRQLQSDFANVTEEYRGFAPDRPTPDILSMASIFESLIRSCVAWLENFAALYR